MSAESGSGGLVPSLVTWADSGENDDSDRLRFFCLGRFGGDCRVGSAGSRLSNEEARGAPSRPSWIEDAAAAGMRALTEEEEEGRGRTTRATKAYRRGKARGTSNTKGKKEEDALSTCGV